MNVVLQYLRVPAVSGGLKAAVIAGCVLALVIHGYWAPAEARHAERRAELIVAQIEVAQLRERLDRSVAFDTTETQLEALEARFAAAADRSRVVALLSELSAAHGTRIINAANRFGTVRNGVRPVMQDLTVEGGFAAVAGFLDALARIETLTLIRQADFTPDAEGSRVRLDLKLVTWSRDTSG